MTPDGGIVFQSPGLVNFLGTRELALDLIQTTVFTPYQMETKGDEEAIQVASHIESEAAASAVPGATPELMTETASAGVDNAVPNNAVDASLSDSAVMAASESVLETAPNSEVEAAVLNHAAVESAKRALEVRACLLIDNFTYMISMGTEISTVQSS